MTLNVYRSRRGLITYLIAIFSVLGSVGAAKILFDAYLLSTRSISTLSTIALVFGLSFLYFGIEQATIQYVVTLEDVEARSILGKRKVAWEEVQKMNAIPTFYGVINISLITFPGKKNFWLGIGFLANRRILAKAIIEAGLRSNSTLQIDRELIEIYGSPPYGIFVQGAKDTSP